MAEPETPGGTFFTKLLDFALRYGAVFAIAPMATVFAYDVLYWRNIEPRVLFSFALSDHIETAVSVVAYLVMVILGLVIWNLGNEYGNLYATTLRHKSKKLYVLVCAATA